MEDEVIVRIVRDLPDTYFENYEFPDFKVGDLVRARIDRDGIAHVNYG